MIKEVKISNTKKQETKAVEKIDKRILQFFSCLSDETRLRILLCLAEKPKNVSELHEHLGKNSITLSAVSHQLRQLSDLEIVVFEKMGREKRFALSNDFCWCILKDAFKHYEGKKSCCARCDEVRNV